MPWPAPLALVPVLLAATLGCALPAQADMRVYPAISGAGDQHLTLYMSLDESLARPLIEGFQTRHPDIAVRFDDLLTGAIFDRIVAETDAGTATADVAFSSAMDLQIKLANDGYARPTPTPASDDWPRWANWRDTAYAITFEPAVLVYHKPSFAGRPPPRTRFELLDWLQGGDRQVQGRIGTYDIARSGVGYLFLARDQEHFFDIWNLGDAMGRAGVQQFATSAEILDRVADGRLAVGYNILGSYAAEWARREPDLGLHLPHDFTVVLSRVALVPKAAARPDLGADFLAFLMSRDGQMILAEKLRLPAVSLEVSARAGQGAMPEALGAQLRPVPISPGLLAYLDQSRRARLIARWQQALSPPG
ncbi:ABC transporter substrate-binding protein [Paracoccus nototheniae]|uniref:ABC transporter substrate-binding protein n=1 Tax=Paracoccus nototheniae TaxID=2489002 RepID=UPI001A955097|nr:ABC transporter substrate-binding protein [Paracoccus nototheniae]